MVTLSLIKQVVEEQYSRIKLHDGGLERESLLGLPDVMSHTLIISGIRRCGKSTLLNQLIKTRYQDAFFINFDDPRLFEFEIGDFQILDLLIKENNTKILLFDEIQVINGWEIYVRQKMDEGYKVIVTGSNASLLSKELGTRLTGRHLSKELFPFSYHEFITFFSLDANSESLQKYLKTGGFPEFVKTENPDILTTLFEDILYRDIAVRFGIRDVHSLKKLAIYLISNAGNLVTATKLTKIFSIKTAATILEYFSYFELSYLINFLPKFSYSTKAQLINPRKIYVIDPGIISTCSTTFSGNLGHILENIIYWHLRQKNYELYYFNENGKECDFIVFANQKVVQVIQVCYELNHENTEREVLGLSEAMKFFNLDSGIILSFNQNDSLVRNGKMISVIPAFSYLANS